MSRQQQPHGGKNIYWKPRADLPKEPPSAVSRRKHAFDDVLDRQIPVRYAVIGLSFIAVIGAVIAIILRLVP